MIIKLLSIIVLIQTARPVPQDVRFPIVTYINRKSDVRFKHRKNLVNLFNFDADQYGKDVANLFGLFNTGEETTTKKQEETTTKKQEEKTTTKAPSYDIDQSYGIDRTYGIDRIYGIDRTYVIHPSYDIIRTGGIVGFGDFKSIFKKTYADRTEEQYRQQIFLENVRMISNHNDLYRKGIELFSLSINEFADWTHVEYLGIMGIDVTNDYDRREYWYDEVSKICLSPYSKDWRLEGAVTSVKFQSKCASSWAFSAAGALEAQYFLKRGVLNSLSGQQLVDCSSDQGNRGCNTGFMTNAFEYAYNNGIVTENEYPYEAEASICRAAHHSTQSSLKIKRFKTIPRGNEEKLKNAVCNIGPVAVAIDATDVKFKFYNDGVYFSNECKPIVNHAVLVVGYSHDEKTNLDYWIIKNSYGTLWGNEGYGKIARNKGNHCGIANWASYPII